ncbi:MAG: sulfotransferase [Chthoniobacterales bacterium]
MRAPVLIVGAHRSGTSATAEALRVLGLQIGQRLDSHSEPRGLQRVHEEYLHRVGGAWYSPSALLEWLNTEAGAADCVEYLRQSFHRQFHTTFAYRRGLRGLWPVLRTRLGANWGWKEPRTTLFLPAWLKIFPDARVVHVLRHPLDVALSIQRRELHFRAAGDPPNDELHDLGSCLRLAIDYVEAAEAAAPLARHFERVRFEDLQQNAAATLRKLAEFCELNPSRAGDAARGIRPERAGRWKDLPADHARELLARHPVMEKFGYEALPL